MKQSLKYGIWLILALLLHSMVIEVTSEVRISATLSHDTCFLSQAHPMRNAIDNFHHFCSALSCEMGHADLSHVPTDKNFLRLSMRQCEYKGIIPPGYGYSLHLYKHDPEDPLMYYIYGQRKILI